MLLACVALLQYVHACDQNSLQILTDFYEVLSGSQWQRKELWRNAHNCCSWEGIECNDNNDVTSIELRGNNLQGNFPDLSRLHALTRMVLPDNKISGNLSIEPFSDLVEIDVNNNQFESSLPDLSNLRKLRHVDFGNNFFQGVLPEDFSFHMDLSFFHVQNNPSLSNSQFPVFPTSLLDLDIRNASIQGPLPPDIETMMTRMTHFKISDNGISGTLPNIPLPNMVVLHASGNPLECPSVYYGQIQENDYIRRYEECYAMAHASTRIVPEVAVRFTIVLRTSFCNVNVNIPLDMSYETSGYIIDCVSGDFSNLEDVSYLSVAIATFRPIDTYLRVTSLQWKDAFEYKIRTSSDPDVQVLGVIDITSDDEWLDHVQHTFAPIPLSGIRLPPSAGEPCEDSYLNITGIPSDCPSAVESFHREVCLTVHRMQCCQSCQETPCAYWQDILKQQQCHIIALGGACPYNECERTCCTFIAPTQYPSTTPTTSAPTTMPTFSPTIVAFSDFNIEINVTHIQHTIVKENETVKWFLIGFVIVLFIMALMVGSYFWESCCEDPDDDVTDDSSRKSGFERQSKAKRFARTLFGRNRNDSETRSSDNSDSGRKKHRPEHRAKKSRKKSTVTRRNRNSLSASDSQMKRVASPEVSSKRKNKDDSDAPKRKIKKSGSSMKVADVPKLGKNSPSKASKKLKNQESMSRLDSDDSDSEENAGKKTPSKKVKLLKKATKHDSTWEDADLNKADSPRKRLKLKKQGSLNSHSRKSMKDENGASSKDSKSKYKRQISLYE